MKNLYSTMYKNTYCFEQHLDFQFHGYILRLEGEHSEQRVRIDNSNLYQKLLEKRKFKFLKIKLKSIKQL